MSLSSRQAEAAKKVKKEAEAAKKSLRAELLILAVSKKFTFIQFSLPLYHVSSHFSLMSLSGWSCKEGEGGDDDKEEHQEDGEEKKKKKEEMIVIVEEDEDDE